LDARVDWVKCEEWIRKEYRPKSAYDRILYARRFAHCLLDKDCSDLLALNNEKRAHVMRALSALSKFLGIHERFTALVKNYGLKWSVRSDDLLIARFAKARNPDAVFSWIREVKQKCRDLAGYMDLVLITGLRFEEGINCYNLIIRLPKEGKLREYYDPEREILEHYRFKDVFIRRTKKAFVSFVPRELVERIGKRRILSKFCVQSKVKRATHQVRFGDLREIHGTLSARYLGEAENDFLHGRVLTSVFMRNYFNPALIGDLKGRVFKGLEELDKAIFEDKA
jgi:intergrase/recombinase